VQAVQAVQAVGATRETDHLVFGADDRLAARAGWEIG
jgi:hypothetical protein